MTGNGDRVGGGCVGGARNGGENGGADRAARMLSGDLEALRTATARDLPPLAETQADAIASTSGGRGRAPAANPGGTLMNALRNTRKRPWLVTALGTAAVALVLLFVPISYDRLIGTELTLSFDGTEIAPSSIREIAGDLRAKLGAEKVRVETGTGGLTLTADMPNASWRRVSQLAIDYAKGLAGQGIVAVPRVRPRIEKVHGNVYAAIGSLVEIRIQSEGKSDEEIASEIQAQLLAAGLSDATVEVHRADGRTEIRVEAQQMTEGDAPDGGEPRQFRISVDGKTPGDGDTQTETAQVRVQRTEGMTDEQVIEQIKQQLESQGVRVARVYYDENHKLQIEREGQ